MKKSLLPRAVFFLLALGVSNSFAQNSEIKRTYHWYFYAGAGVDFSGSVPVGSANNASYDLGSACMSDTAGNFLFATAGSLIWDKNKNLMPNGNSPNWSNNWNSNIILPKPGSDSLYYVFTNDSNSLGVGYFSYSVVDMSLNGGLGDVTVKNFALDTTWSECVTAVRHNNGIDIWVISHVCGTNSFYAYLLTNAGVNPVPVISNVGLVHTDCRGLVKASPDGQHIVSSDFWGSDLSDFNNATGIVSNAIALPSGSAIWGLSFSPNSKVLYISHVLGGIDQYDLAASNIPASMTPIAPGGSFFGNIQQASDGKIYTITVNSTNYAFYLGVINCPNTLGLACNYKDEGVWLGGTYGDPSLPNFFEAYFHENKIINAGPDVTICPGDSATLNASGNGIYLWNNGQTSASIIVFPTATTTYTVTVANSCNLDTVTVFVSSPPNAAILGNTTICTGTSTTLTAFGGTSYLWNSGQTTSSINIIPSATTTYSVIVSSGSCADTASVIVTMNSSVTATASGATTICSGLSVVLTALGGTNYLWNNGNTNSTINVSPTSTTTYSVILSTGDCSDTAFTTITINPNPTAVAFSNTTITQGQSVTLTASGGGTYSWSNGVIGSSIAVAPPVTTIYCVTVTDANNCADTACITVAIEPLDCSTAGELYIPNAFSPNGDGENDNVQIYYGNRRCIKTLQLSIYNRWGEEVFSTSDPSLQWDGMYEAEPMNTAVFVYYLEATLISGEEISRKGNISLIK